MAPRQQSILRGGLLLLSVYDTPRTGATSRGRGPHPDTRSDRGHSVVELMITIKTGIGARGEGTPMAGKEGILKIYKRCLMTIFGRTSRNSCRIRDNETMLIRTKPDSIIWRPRAGGNAYVDRNDICQNCTTGGGGSHTYIYIYIYKNMYLNTIQDTDM